MKKLRRVFCIVFALVLGLQLSAVCFCAFAAECALFVNGQPFSGTVAQAIAAAGAGGTVEIQGTVYTEPIGKRDGSLVTDITICGRGDGAELVLTEDFIPQEDDNLDVLTIKGRNVTIKDLTVDARFFVDYPLCVFGGTDNIDIENVSVFHGFRGGVNVMTNGHVLFKNVKANDTVQGGFVFECTGDASNILFENCTTEGNLYKAGLIIKNGYGPCINVDASGLTCYEDCFAFHDRVTGTIGGGERADLILKAPPKNSEGEPISLEYGVYYPLEKAYQHIRFGADESETTTAKYKLTTAKYGFNTVVYYDDANVAQAAVYGDDVLEPITNDVNLPVSFMRIISFIMRLFKLIA